jgi:hypothetical protein
MADGDMNGPPEQGQREPRAGEWTRLNLSGGPVRHGGRYAQPPEQAADVSAFDELVLHLTVPDDTGGDVEVRLLTARAGDPDWCVLRRFPIAVAESCATLRLTDFLDYLRNELVSDAPESFDLSGAGRRRV